MKTSKSKPKDTQIIDSKTAQLAKIIYAAIVRYVKAENARNGEKSSRLALDFGRERRVNMHTEGFD